MNTENAVPPGGDGAPPPAPPPGAPPTAAPPPPLGAAGALTGGHGPPLPEWAAGLPDDDRAWLGKAGHKEVGALVKSVRHLEGLLGHDKAGRAVVVPASAEDAEGWGALYARLGRPETADGYGLAAVEGADAGFSAAAAAEFHKLGLSKAQADGLAAFWQARHAGAGERLAAASAERDAREAGELRASLGAGYDAALDRAHRAAGRFGLDDGALEQLRRAIGPRALVTFLAGVGEATGEDPLPAGGQDGQHLPGSQPAALRDLEAKRADPDFMAKYLAGDAAAAAALAELYRRAYPGTSPLSTGHTGRPGLPGQRARPGAGAS